MVLNEVLEIEIDGIEALASSQYIIEFEEEEEEYISLQGLYSEEADGKKELQMGQNDEFNELDSLDPDERAAYFWQRDIANLPERMCGCN